MLGEVLNAGSLMRGSCNRVSDELFGLGVLLPASFTHSAFTFHSEAGKPNLTSSLYRTYKVIQCFSSHSSPD